MSNVPEHLIEEARKRGIVEGAKVNSGYGVERGEENHFIVLPIDQWLMEGNAIVDGGSRMFRTILTRDGVWASPLTPAEEGLREGDACECSSEMRAAIIAEAKKLGLLIGDLEGGLARGFPSLCWGKELPKLSAYRYASSDIGYTLLPDIEFLRRLRLMKPKEPDIEVGGHVVKFKADRSITVGCTTVDFDTLERVYQRAKAQRK